uniref:Uncharacterized protein n=1 Tax=Romanomermis culicivorax TaxID=13658 RepID=A0A915IPR0_ROMCU
MNEPSFPLDYSSSSRQTSTESNNNVAASSSAYLHTTLPVISFTSPSPRKRQRKQRLDELPSESVSTNSLGPLFCPQQSQAVSSRPPVNLKPAPPLNTFQSQRVGSRYYPAL